MKLGRREAIQLGVSAALGLGLTGCESLEQRFTKPVLPSTPWAPTGATSTDAVLLNRIGFGPNPSDLATVRSMGKASYIEQQLDPDGIAEAPVLTFRVRSLNDILSADPGILFDIDDRVAVATLRQATILRAVYSKKQLFERVVSFWTDHFNIYEGKGEGPQLKIIDDRETIRKHAFGNFRDLLGSSARSAAMLGYLDNRINEKRHPNENYAREIMELHTLGVNGGYTQHDVQEVARCLTGWTTQAHWHRSGFSFDSDMHDNGVKTVLGVTIPAGGGIKDGDHVLDILAAHPSTAGHISRKLCRYFIGDASDRLIDQTAAEFRRTDGDIKATLRPILYSPELMSGQPQFKRPFDYVVSALRAVNADTDGGPGIQTALEQLGQPLFGWPRPDGFPEKAQPWIGNMLGRWNVALALASGQISNTHVDLDALVHSASGQNKKSSDMLTEIILGRDGKSPESILTATDAMRPTEEQAAILLMSPAFQYR